MHAGCLNRRPQNTNINEYNEGAGSRVGIISKYPWKAFHGTTTVNNDKGFSRTQFVYGSGTSVCFGYKIIKRFQHGC